MLRPLLKYAHEDPKVTALADAARTEPQRAFVSASLRPYLLASLLDAEPERPALVVAGDDRAARDLAADLRVFLAPRPVRFYPGARHAVRVPSRAPATSRGAPDRGAGCAAGRARGRACRRRRGAGREGARPRPAPARLRDREGRPARPRRGVRGAGGLRLRARRPGRGARPVRRPRRHPRRLPRHRGARGALRAVRRRGRAPDLVLHVHPALARRGGARGDRAGGRARARAPRARRDRGEHRGRRAPRHRRRAAGGPLPASCSTSCRRRRS